MSTRIIAATVILFIACGAPRDQAAARAQSAPLPTGTLDQLLAPVALYPDQLLAQMLISATEPAKVLAVIVAESGKPVTVPEKQ